jgi:hypothetical protein
MPSAADIDFAVTDDGYGDPLYYASASNLMVAYRDPSSPFPEEWQLAEENLSSLKLVWNNNQEIQFLGWDGNNPSCADTCTAAPTFLFGASGLSAEIAWDEGSGVWCLSWDPGSNEEFLWVVRNSALGRQVIASFDADLGYGTLTLDPDVDWHNADLRVVLVVPYGCETFLLSQMSGPLLPFGGIPVAPASIQATYLAADPEIAGSQEGWLLTWDDTSDGETSYRVQAKYGEDGWVTINPLFSDPGHNSVAPDYTSLFDAHYADYVQYRVCAINKDPLSEDFFSSDWIYSDTYYL